MTCPLCGNGDMEEDVPFPVLHGPLDDFLNPHIIAKICRMCVEAKAYTKDAPDSDPTSGYWVLCHGTEKAITLSEREKTILALVDVG